MYSLWWWIDVEGVSLGYNMIWMIKIIIIIKRVGKEKGRKMGCVLFICIYLYKKEKFFDSEWI